MDRVQVEELYRELEATDEHFVRRKFATSGYADWRAPHVQRYLAGLDAQQAAATQASVALWTKIGAMGGVATVVVALVTIFIAKGH